MAKTNISLMFDVKQRLVVKKSLNLNQDKVWPPKQLLAKERQQLKCASTVNKLPGLLQQYVRSNPSLFYSFDAIDEDNPWDTKYSQKLKRYNYDITGTRGKYVIFSLQFLLWTLRKLEFTIKAVLYGGGVIVFATVNRKFFKMISMAGSRCKMPYYAGPWIGGMVTNFLIANSTLFTPKFDYDHTDKAYPELLFVPDLRHIRFIHEITKVAIPLLTLTTSMLGRHALFPLLGGATRANVLFYSFFFMSIINQIKKLMVAPDNNFMPFPMATETPALAHLSAAKESLSFTEEK